ncbi:HAD family hydrolase [Streptomyces sp. TP-A0356]|uniref:HAD family hydrolase n=1 Tax=Streptomyces sp. TP-A0356 TaxID=1359208 RepID=UPI0006E2776E|nr:HAD family hydrolase [Streptomyces sp. TP-A0356]
MKRREVVILDLDGTLIDERGTVDQAFLAVGQVVQAHVGLDAYRFARTARVTAQRLWWKATWTDPLSDIFGISAWDGLSEDFTEAVPALDRLHAWLPAFRQASWRLALERVGITDPGLAETISVSYTQHRHRDARPLPGAVELVEALACDRRLVVLTNGPGDGQRRKLQSSGLMDHMRDLVISTEVGFAKPDPRAVSLAVDRVGGKREEAIMIGDTYERDVLGALACNVPAIWVADRSPEVRLEHPLVTTVVSTAAVLAALHELEAPEVVPRLNAWTALLGKRGSAPGRRS